MKNIRTKGGEFDSSQLLIGIGILLIGILLISLSFFQSLSLLFIIIGISTIWTSWYDIYYCTNCGNNHGEYPYSKCEKCGKEEFSNNKKYKS